MNVIGNTAGYDRFRECRTTDYSWETVVHALAEDENDLGLLRPNCRLAKSAFLEQEMKEDLEGMGVLRECAQHPGCLRIFLELVLRNR